MLVTGYGMIRQSVEYDSTNSRWALGTANSGYRALQDVAADRDVVGYWLRDSSLEWANGIAYYDGPNVALVPVAQFEASASWPDPVPDTTAATLVLGAIPKLQSPLAFIGNHSGGVEIPTVTPTAIPLLDGTTVIDPLDLWDAGNTQLTWFPAAAMMDGIVQITWPGVTSGTYRKATLQFDALNADTPVTRTWDESVAGTTTVLQMFPHAATADTDYIKLLIEHDASESLYVTVSAAFRYYFGVPDYLLSGAP